MCGAKENIHEKEQHKIIHHKIKDDRITNTLTTRYKDTTREEPDETSRVQSIGIE